MVRSTLLFLTLALLSGGAFAGYKYWTLTRDAQRRGQLSGIRGPDDLSPKQLEELLKSSQEATSELLTLSRTKSAERPAGAIQDQFALVAGNHERLSAGGADEEQLLQSHWTLLYATYAAARADPAHHRDAFSRLSSEMRADDPTSELAANAALLQVLSRHEFNQPATPQLLADLNRYASEFSPALGAKLFKLVAGELVQGGERESAQLVLRHGMQAFASTADASSLSAALAQLEPKTNRSAGNSSWTIRVEPVVLPVPRKLKSKASSSQQKKNCRPRPGRR